MHVGVEGFMNKTRMPSPYTVDFSFVLAVVVDVDVRTTWLLAHQSTNRPARK